MREAGGTVTTFSGQPYRPGDRETLASNGRVHEEMREVAADMANAPPSARARSETLDVAQYQGITFTWPRRACASIDSAAKRVLGSRLGSLSVQ